MFSVGKYQLVFSKRITAITALKVYNNIHHTYINVPGYNVFRKDREAGRGGGVLIYVREKYKCELIRWPKEANVECIGLNISLCPAMSFTVICVYRPPSAKDVFYDHLQTILKHCNSKKEIILLGDFNVNWDSKSDKKKIKHLTDKYNLIQIIKGPTRITNTSNTTIDLIFTNRPERISKTFNLLSGLSDHNFILCTRKIKRKHIMESTRGQQYYFIPKNQLQSLNEEIQKVDWSDILKNNDVEASSDSFIKKVNDVIIRFMKKGKSKQHRNHLPWLNNEIIKLMKNRDNALKQSLRTRTISDRHIFTSLRNKVLRMTRKSKAEFYIETIKRANGNGKLIWNNLNKLLKREKSNYSVLQLQVNDEITDNLDIIVNHLNRYFIESVEELTKHLKCSHIPHNPADLSKPIFSIEEISVSEVIKIISSLKSSNARDAYGLSSDFLKTHKEVLADPIAHLVNLSIKQGMVPSSRKIARVTPIFKAGDKTEPDNYRPISILPIISKVAEKWVTTKLTEHLNNGYATLHPMQFGFRKFHSTETATCYFLENLKSLLDQGGFVAAVFLDLKRAFDTINHDLLIAKLSHFNFSSNALCWMKSYLTDRKQAVQIGDSLSTYLTCSTGVPQGSILGPVLFSLYVNNLPDVCRNIKMQLYADDTVLYCHANSIQESAAILSGAMVPVSHWLENCCLHLNIKKTVCMYFSRQSTEGQLPSVIVGGERLDVVDHFKYLGVNFDSNLNFKQHVKTVKNTIKFNLSNFKHIRPFLTMEAAKTYMHAMIFSHISYCYTTWSHTSESTLKPIKSLFKRTIKTLDKKPVHYHYCKMTNKYKILDLDSYQFFLDVCLVYKVLNGLAPPPLQEFIKKKSSRANTRALSRGDCYVQRRRTKFGQMVVSIRGVQSWNSLPAHVRSCHNYTTFKKTLKQWLVTNQICSHE
ncbi:MAG: hypothetical protein ATN33_01430 [Epulopiscium sp. Nele67-Bin001]|nr:MAG: hypothetical protein ATN33_01430 [Epulopiscium sp. Nele67-Bin001]